MKILSLELQNFGPIANASIALDDRGLVNIEGVNKDDPSADSNGSGKSTLPDGLSWVLFGETARDVSGDDVIANFAKKDCWGRVKLDDDGTIYVVERWRKKKDMGKPNGVSLVRYDEESPFDLTAGTDKLTQAKIEQVLGCSKAVFTNAIYSGQEALPDLPKMTDKQIKTLVEEAAGIEILTRAYDFARSHKRDVDANYATSVRACDEFDRQVVDCDARIHGLTEKAAEWEVEITGRVATKQHDRKVSRDRVTAAEASVAAHVRPAVEAKLKELRATVDALSEESDNLRDFAAEVSTARSNASSKRATFESKIAEVRRVKTHFDSVGSLIGKPCGECGKTYAEADLGEARTIAQNNMTARAEEARTLQAEYEAATKLVDAAQKRHDDYKASMTDVSATLDHIRRCEDMLRLMDREVNDLALARRDLAAIEEALAVLVAEKNPYLPLLVAEKAKRSKAWDELEEAKKAVEVARKDAQVADDAVKAFGPTGVRAFVLDTVTPFLNARTAHYLGTLSDGRIEAIWTTLSTNAKGELTEKFNIEVAKAGGGQSFKALSGGEKRKVRLSCALALQDLVSSRASKPLSIWIGDEVDDALDESGLERLMAVLEEKAREKGTVLVISHNSLSDFIRETVTVTMEGGRSTVTGALS